jgi:hypothetical protein
MYLEVLSFYLQHWVTGQLQGSSCKAFVHRILKVLLHGAKGVVVTLIQHHWGGKGIGGLECSLHRPSCSFSPPSYTVSEVQPILSFHHCFVFLFLTYMFCHSFLEAWKIFSPSLIFWTLVLCRELSGYAHLETHLL